MYPLPDCAGYEAASAAVVQRLCVRNTACYPAEHAGPWNLGTDCQQYLRTKQLVSRCLKPVLPRLGSFKDKSHLGLLRSLLQRDLCAFDSIGLPAAHAQKAPVLGHRDGIALHMLHYAPGKAQVLQLLLCGLCV